MLSAGSPLQAIVECATALERAEASARVLAARAAGHGGAPRAFAELAAIAPPGLIPTPGRGAAHVARQIERAADVAVGARDLLGAEVVDAVEWAASMTRRVAATSDALDPTGASRAARRGVATVRGLIASTIDRDVRWQAFRLGTHLPRAGWVSALVAACARVAESAGRVEAWRIAAAVTGVSGKEEEVATRLLTDGDAVVTIAHALSESEGSLVALHKHGTVSSASVGLAREAQARLRQTASAFALDAEGAADALERLLDGLGALVESVDPTIADTSGWSPPSPRRPGRWDVTPTAA